VKKGRKSNTRESRENEASKRRRNGPDKKDGAGKLTQIKKQATKQQCEGVKKKKAIGKNNFITNKREESDE